VRGAADRVALFTPALAVELRTNRLGGAVQWQGATLFLSDAGYFTPITAPGTQPCRRADVVIQGTPAPPVVSWEKPGAALRFEIPRGKGDVSRASALSLPATFDPLSKLNAQAQRQEFSIQVTDGARRTARVTSRPDEPALRCPEGEVVADARFGAMFIGRLPLTTERAPMLLCKVWKGRTFGRLRWCSTRRKAGRSSWPTWSGYAPRSSRRALSGQPWTIGPLRMPRTPYVDLFSPLSSC
jgi:hypothetical protein